jgi:hypothetical protein
MKKKVRFLIGMLLILNFGSFQGKAKETLKSIPKKDLKSSFSPENISKYNSIEWPLVYPNRYKAILNLGTQRNTYSSGATALGLSLGASLEMLWEQTLFYGLGYQFNSVSKLDSLAGGTIHWIALQTGVIFQLDNYERHHVLIHFRPGMALLKSKELNASAFGVGLGFGYDYTLNSDFVIAPEIIYNWYPAISDSPYSVAGWYIGLRVSFGR